MGLAGKEGAGVKSHVAFGSPRAALHGTLQMHLKAPVPACPSRMACATCARIVAKPCLVG